MFSAARAAPKAAPEPLDLKTYWFFAALDAIDTFNYLSMTRDRTFTPSPHTPMQIHGHSIDEREGPNSFLPYEQARWIENRAKQKKKQDERATQAN